jgi:hypothetical protein
VDWSDALLLDVDGTPLDTEGVLLRTWQAEYRRHCCSLTETAWADGMGSLGRKFLREPAVPHAGSEVAQDQAPVLTEHLLHPGGGDDAPPGHHEVRRIRTGGKTY